MVVTVWVVIAMNLFAHLSIGHVMRKLARGLRFVWPDPSYRLPKASALTYRRYQLGARSMAALFRRLCRPLATPQTPGAFRFGRRLMAIDGTVEDLPDTCRSRLFVSVGLLDFCFSPPHPDARSFCSFPCPTHEGFRHAIRRLSAAYVSRLPLPI
jgi:hypothetical protein